MLIPAILLVVVPGLVLAWRFGVLEVPWARWLLAVLGLAITLWAMPFEGTDFETLKHVKMLLALTAASVLVAHRLRPWRRRVLDRTLLALALLGVANWLNYGAFHGQRTFVHLHDVAHYYLGAKYYGELGYTDLYVAMLRAEAENHDDRFRAIEARDLRDYRRVHIRTLLQQSEPVKEAFAAERWFDFRRDADYFRENLRDHYGKVLLDHGFNPTPVWALLGGSLAERVPPGSHRGLLFLTLLDPLLLVLSFAALGWAFGRRTMVLGLLLFTVCFGATFGWVGGAFLRYTWFFGVVAGLACLRKKHYGWAGALFAVATMLRVFPFIFLLPMAAKAAWILIRERRLEKRYLRLAAGFAATALLLFLATGLLPRGFAHWSEFHDNMSLHLRNISPNVVGVTEWVAHRWSAQGLVTQEEFDALKDRRASLHRWQQILVFLPLSLIVAWAARRRSDLFCIALAFPLLLSGLSLAAYYYAFLVLLVPIFRRSEIALAAIFASEWVAFTFRLFEDSEARLFIYRGMALAWLFGFLLLRSSWLERRRRPGIMSSPSSAHSPDISDPSDLSSSESAPSPPEDGQPNLSTPLTSPAPQDTNP